MWARNLLFLGVCFVGVAALAAMLSPQQRVATPHDLPAVAGADLQASVERVNAAFARDWKAKALAPAPRASDLAIARRLSLALAGTVPSLEEIRQFESQPADRRVSWHLAGLLEDRRASDYLAERWARAMVGVEDGPFVIYRRRRFVSWLADALHVNRPYDEIAREVIATDGLWTDHPATNFITVTVKPDEGLGPDENALAARVSRAFLGVRLDCAECHDHPFQRWKQGDFEGLAAFFGQTQQSFTGIHEVDAPFEVEDRATGAKRVVEPAVPFAPKLLGESGNRRQRLAAWITHGDNKAFARVTVNRTWAVLFGRPLVEPVDDLPTDTIGRWPAALDVLADDFSAHGYDLKRLIAVIALSAPFQADSRAADDASEESVTAEAEDAFAAFPVTRLRPEQVVGGVLQSSSLATIDYESHILVRIARVTGQNEFIERYGDAGENEFDDAGGTIPQRLLLMNGELVREKTTDDLVSNASTQIAALASTAERAIETAYLTVLTRRPSETESRYFAERFADEARSRREHVEDLYWTLLNSTEFSWNH